MAQILTSRQAEELHKSVIAYLAANNFSNSVAALRAELNLDEGSFPEATAKKYEGLLEKKWTSVVRLQKKIMDLESKNTALQTELETSTPTSRQNKDPVSWLPRTPARHTLQSHREPITCVAFHPIFTSLASGSEDNAIKIWDWELGELERTLKGHTRAVLDVDFGGPRGNTLLASCSSDLTIKLWDPANEYNNIRTLPGHDHSVSAVRFIPSGGAAGSAGNLLVSASRDKTLRIWDVSTGFCVKTLRGHAEWVRDVCPSPDGRFVLSTSDDYTARMWDISVSNPETKVTFLGHEHHVQCCALAPRAAYKHLAALAGVKKPPAGSAEFVATGSRDKTIRLWDARGTCIKTLVGHDNWVRALAFHPGGKYLLSASDDKTLRCWDLTQEGRCVKVLSDAHGHFISCMRWAPSVVKDVSPATNGGGADGPDGAVAVNGTPPRSNGVTAAAAGGDAQIRCVIATGSVDLNVRIFAN